LHYYIKLNNHNDNVTFINKKINSPTPEFFILSHSGIEKFCKNKLPGVTKL